MKEQQFLKECRGILFALLGLSILFSLTGPTFGAGNDYPNKPIILIVGNTPGGSVGISAQIFADVAKSYLPNKQSILVSYKPGAATAVSADYVLKQPADGYNVLWLSMSLVGKMAKDPDKLSFTKEDFILIGTFVKTPFVVPYNKEKGVAKTFVDFIAIAKKQPDEITFGSTGFGSSGHVTAEILQMRTGIKLHQIPFKGASPARTALMGGHVDTMFTTLASVRSQIRPGAGLGLLAVLIEDKRLPAIPDVPTSQELGIGIDRYFWVAMAVPKGTPSTVTKVLQDVLEKTAQDPQVKAKIDNMGYLPANWGPEETKKRLNEEFELARDIFKKAGK